MASDTTTITMHFRFLALPRELRNVVYKHYMDATGQLKLHSRIHYHQTTKDRLSTSKVDNHTHALLSTCGQVRLEYAHELKIANHFEYILHFKPAINTLCSSNWMLDFAKRSESSHDLFGDLSVAKHVHLELDLGDILCKARPSSCDCPLHTVDISRCLFPGERETLAPMDSIRRIAFFEFTLQGFAFQAAANFTNCYCKDLESLKVDISNCWLEQPSASRYLREVLRGRMRELLGGDKALVVEVDMTDLK